MTEEWERIKARIAELEYDLAAAACRGSDMVVLLLEGELRRFYRELAQLMNHVWIKSGYYRGEWRDSEEPRR